MNPILHEHLNSFLQTFITVFVVTAGITLSNGEIVWTGAFWSSVIIGAVRAGVKEGFARLAPKVLGGRR